MKKSVLYLDELVSVLLRLSELSPVSPSRQFEIRQINCHSNDSLAARPPSGRNLNNEVLIQKRGMVSFQHYSILFFSDIWICIDFHYFFVTFRVAPVVNIIRELFIYAFVQSVNLNLTF